MLNIRQSDIRRKPVNWNPADTDPFIILSSGKFDKFGQITKIIKLN